MGYPRDEGLHCRLFQDESDSYVARGFGLKDATLIILVLVVVSILVREAYSTGVEDGYWEAIEEENAYSCEIF